MEIILDTREKADLRTWIKLQFPGINFIEKALPEGDILIKCENDKYPRVLIERKTIADLYGSVVGGVGKKPRFPEQCIRLITHQTNSIVVLLVTGSVSEFVTTMKRVKNIEVDPDFIDSIIASVLTRYNIRVIIDPDHETGLKRAIRVGIAVCAGKADITQSRNCDALIARLLNITLVQWKSIKKTYGPDLTYIAKLSDEQLMCIDGLGKVKSKRVRDMISGKSDDWF